MTLRILESKRAQDREKLKQAEKARVESEQFLAVKEKLAGKRKKIRMASVCAPPLMAYR